jgi:hypothetical protein
VPPFFNASANLLRIRQRRMSRRWRSAEEIDMHTQTTIATAVKDIPLDKLKRSPANVRRTGGEIGLEEFAASIAAHGLLQPLVVQAEMNGEGGETGCYLDTAGERRRKALLILAKLLIHKIFLQMAAKGLLILHEVSILFERSLWMI